MTSFQQFSNKLWPTHWSKWIWIGLAAVPAIRLYYVQEMIAALVIFSVLFVVGAIALLILFFLDRAGQQVVVWTEIGIARLGHRVVEAIEGVVARPICAQAVPHHLRKEQLKEKD